MRRLPRPKTISVPAGKVMRLMGWHTWHIVGNSYSILEEDLSGLKNTIGLNRILRHKTFVPDYLLMVDEGVRWKERERLRAYKGKIIRYSRLTRLWGESFEIEDGYYPQRRFTGTFARSMNTAMYAAEWASRQIYPGRGQIVLHGVDFKTKRGKPSHFFGKGAKEGCSDIQWATVLRTMAVTAKFLWTNKIRLLNASPWHGPLDKIIPRVVR